MGACPVRRPCVRMDHRLERRLSLLMVFLGAVWLGQAVNPSPVQGGRLSEFLPQLFGTGLRVIHFGDRELSAIHFRLTSVAELQRLNESLTPQLVLPPFASPSTGFIFDVELGVPKRVRESLGPAIGEKAITLGQGRANLALTYSYLDYTRFRGQTLSDLRFTVPHDLPPPPSPPFAGQDDTVDVQLDLRITRHVLAFSSTLGVTDDLDLGLSLPYIFTNMEADAQATINSPGSIHTFADGTNRLPVSKEQSDERFGDLRLLGKYILLRDVQWIGNLGITGEVKVPTGSARNLSGTGSTQITGALIASRDFDWLGPHLNIGFTYDFRDQQNNLLKTLFGFDARIFPRLTFASDILWRYRTHGGSGTNTVDFVAGLRWNPYRDLVVTGSAQIPLNKNVGLRTDVTPSLTLEYTF